MRRTEEEDAQNAKKRRANGPRARSSLRGADNNSKEHVTKIGPNGSGQGCARACGCTGGEASDGRQGEEVFADRWTRACVRLLRDSGTRWASGPEIRPRRRKKFTRNANAIRQGYSLQKQRITCEAGGETWVNYNHCVCRSQ